MSDGYAYSYALRFTKWSIEEATSSKGTIVVTCPIVQNQPMICLSVTAADGKSHKIMYYDGDNVAGAAAYILGQYKPGSWPKVELYQMSNPLKDIATWYVTQPAGGIFNGIEGVKSMLMSMQVKTGF